MHPTKLIGALVLLVVSVGVRSQRGEDGEIEDYRNDTYDNIESQRPRPNEMSKCEPFGSTRCKKERHGASLKAHVIKYLNIRLGDLSDLKVRLPPAQPIDDTPPDFSELQSLCPSGFQYVNLARSCYKVVYEKHNWPSADQRCRDLHPKAHLVAITTKEENIGLKAYLKMDLAKNSHIKVCKLRSWRHRGQPLWTSGRRLNRTSCEKPFVWKLSNKTRLPLSYTHWYPGRPGCFRNKAPCVHLISTNDFRWEDTGCSYKFCPLCEYDLP